MPVDGYTLYSKGLQTPKSMNISSPTSIAPTIVGSLSIFSFPSAAELGAPGIDGFGSEGLDSGVKVSCSISELDWLFMVRSTLPAKLLALVGLFWNQVDKAGFSCFAYSQAALARFLTMMFTLIGCEKYLMPVQMNFSAVGLASTAAFT